MVLSLVKSSQHNFLFYRFNVQKIFEFYKSITIFYLLIKLLIIRAKIIFYEDSSYF